ncbi:putative lipase 2 protein [Botrytis fragariae]|uniref:Carboxylic ester hydrolase n=1 Tax=Botrytis fragariae TaxID=1964551 RepID=A0A8H6AMR3_9HELO|nr:putative lipase 2 protein [Botrytis fragariae]KAF5870623.1 putative lipase 2 protein [Botrytis fragariae]
MILISQLLILPSLASSLLVRTAPQSRPPTVTVKNGTYVGFNDPTLNTDNFYGVAYAKPPIGDRRFRPPQSLDSPWSEDREVVEYPKECITPANNTSTEKSVNMSEDCLYMTIIRPSNVTQKNLPVLVYLDQGGFLNGGAGWFQTFNQTWIVQRSSNIGSPILGVSVNSRLGPWGFMYSQEIQDTLNTNLGLRDMRMALVWIQENIAAFGGDPSRVTIQGQSTGAQSVGLQLLAYGGQHDNLFSGAISESGAPVWYAPTASVDLWQPTYNGFVKAAGCTSANDSLACLRQVSNATLVNVFANQTLNPFGANAPREYMFAVDGDFIPEPNSVLLQAGKFAKVPYLIGTNFDEGTTVGSKGVNNTADLNTYLIKEMLTLDNFSLSTIGYLYPDIPEIGIPATYEGRPPATPSLGAQYKRASAVGSDIIMDGPTRLTTLAMASFNSTVYRYHFNVVPNGFTNAQGATHAAEVPLTFYNLPGNGYTTNPLGGPNSEKLIAMADIMTAMWIGFVTNGDPNSVIRALDPSVPIWPRYTLPSPRNFVFTINESLYTEPDTYRAAGINWIMDMMIASKNRNCTSIVACGGGYNITNGETGGVYQY